MRPPRTGRPVIVAVAAPTGLTSATCTTPAGHRVDGVGITPGVTVAGSPPAVSTARAVAPLLAQASDAGS